MLTHANLIANTAGRLVNFTTRTPRPVHPHPGAVLTHGNLVANAAGTATLMVDFAPGDRHLSYLPLAHIYERSNIVLVGAQGHLEGAKLLLVRMSLLYMRHPCADRGPSPRPGPDPHGPHSTLAHAN